MQASADIQAVQIPLFPRYLLTIKRKDGSVHSEHPIQLLDFESAFQRARAIFHEQANLQKECIGSGGGLLLYFEAVP